MHASFDLKCGYRVYVGTDWINNFMELHITEIKGLGEDNALRISLNNITRTEARAVASALMGGAAELNNPIKENPLVECWGCKGKGTKTFRTVDEKLVEGTCLICNGRKVTPKYHPNNTAPIVPWVNPDEPTEP
jgi:hypothetical protein